MNKNILIILVAVAILGSSCKDFLAVNEVSPNNPSKVAAKLVLPAALNNVAFTMNYPRRFDFCYLWYGQWSISTGYTQPVNLVSYHLLNADYQQPFRDFYTEGQNFDMIEKTNTDPKDVYFVAVSQIMKAYIFQNLVDVYGDVPYSDAFKADKGNLKPKYDAQQTIYEDLVVQLDAAMAAIQAAPIGANALDASSDIIYHGDMSKWLKFANTLKLRILLHQADMPGRTSYITTAIATTSSIGYIGPNEGALSNPGYTAAYNTALDNKENPFYGYFYNASANSTPDGVTYYMAGKDVVDFMAANHDARLGKVFNKSGTGVYNGNVFGTDPGSQAAFAGTSQLGYSKGDAGTMIGTPDRSAYILTDFESLFIQAEAAELGLIAGDPQALYESAVTQSYLSRGFTSTDAAVFLAQGNLTCNYTNAPDKRKLIITQKWVALNGVAPVEIWTDFRRTSYLHYFDAPGNILIHFSPGGLKPQPPIRLQYPQDEINVNGDNEAAALAAQGFVDEFTTNIFWNTHP